MTPRQGLAGLAALNVAGLAVGIATANALPIVLCGSGLVVLAVSLLRTHRK